jgi:dolichol-phosphate mannosyltransferase
MFVLGMIGEYLGRLYVESKRRPLYLVADIAGPVRGTASLGYSAEQAVLPPAEPPVIAKAPVAKKPRAKKSA